MNEALTTEYTEYLIGLAIEQAKKAGTELEVPIGAVIARGEEIIAAAHNYVELEKKVTAHAEMLAINLASEKLDNWRLNDCVLAVTLEPCFMCYGAIHLSRISTVIFGAKDSRQGACGSIKDLTTLPQSPVVMGGVREAECRALIQDFFRARR